MLETGCTVSIFKIIQWGEELTAVVIATTARRAVDMPSGVDPPSTAFQKSIVKISKTQESPADPAAVKECFLLIVKAV
jgi:hypothetical protein